MSHIPALATHRGSGAEQSASDAHGLVKKVRVERHGVLVMGSVWETLAPPDTKVHCPLSTLGLNGAQSTSAVKLTVLRAITTLPSHAGSNRVPIRVIS